MASDAPEWDLVCDSEIDLVSFQWWHESRPEQRSGAPMGEKDEVARRLVGWLLSNDYGELMAHHLGAADFGDR